MKIARHSLTLEKVIQEEKKQERESESQCHVCISGAKKFISKLVFIA